MYLYVFMKGNMYKKVGIWRKKIEDIRHCLELQRGQVKKYKKENKNTIKVI